MERWNVGSVTGMSPAVTSPIAGKTDRTSFHSTTQEASQQHVRETTNTGAVGTTCGVTEVKHAGLYELRHNVYPVRDLPQKSRNSQELDSVLHPQPFANAQKPLPKCGKLG